MYINENVTVRVVSALRRLVRRRTAADSSENKRIRLRALSARASRGAVGLRFVAAVILAFAFAGAQAASATSAPIHTTATVNMRTGPSTSYAVIMLIPQGTSPDFNCWTQGQNINGVDVWFNVNYAGHSGYYASYYDDSLYSTDSAITSRYGIPQCGSAGSAGGGSGGGTAPSNAVWFGMPFHGTWPNTEGCPDAFPSARCSLPSVHANDYGGDFAMDLQSVAPGTPVYLYAAPKYSSLSVTAKVTKVSYACADLNPAHGGYEVQITLYGNGAEIGHATYAHIQPTVSQGQTISRWGTQLGTVGSYTSSGCWTGPHVHFELYNDVHYACYAPNWGPANWINPTNYIGYMGGAYAYGQHTACPSGA